MRKLARGYLLIVSALDGLSGLVCGILFILAPDGRLMMAGILLPIIRALPLAGVFFQDFRWIGIAMLLVLGIPNTLAFVMLVRRTSRQFVACLVSALLLMLWTGFELIFMYNVPALGYFVVGILSVLASIPFIGSASTTSA